MTLLGCLKIARASLAAQLVKNLSAVRRLGFNPWVEKIPLEKEMATHSSILAQRIPWTEEPGRLQSMRSHRVGHDLATFTSLSLCLGFTPNSPSPKELLFILQNTS